MPPSQNQPLRLSADDLYAPEVQEYLDVQAMMNRALPEAEPLPWIFRVLYSSFFYLSMASGLGAFVAWLCLEPFVTDADVPGRSDWLDDWLIFCSVTGLVGLFLGAAEGIMCRNLRRAVICASVGLGVGLAGGIVAVFVAKIIITIMVMIAIQFMKDPQRGNRLTGLSFLILMMGRATAWAVAAIPAGIGQGIALRELKVVVNGLLGGVLGGLLGGMLFDPISVAFPPANGEAWLSRCVGLTMIGLSVGFFVGIVEQWTKSAWLLMKAGPLAGKQFVVFRNPTVLGSSPKADIYLFKDEAIEPRHALIHDRGGRFEIEDMDSADGTYVNGIPVKRQILHPGDQIVLGKTVLEFALKENK